MRISWVYDRVKSIQGLFLFCASLLLVSCAQTNGSVDPYEKINRKIYTLNTTVDQYTFKPVAKVYTKVVPKIARVGVDNVTANLGHAGIFVNDVVQLKPKLAVETLHRFVFNSVFGLGGMIDLTDTFRLPKPHDNDVGMTLARYGWKDSTFIVLPLLGPKTIRDGVGMVGDWYLWPSDYINDVPTRNTAWAIRMVSTRASLLELEELQETISLDPYLFQREGYLAYRKNQLIKLGLLEENQAEEESFDDGPSILEMARNKSNAD